MKVISTEIQSRLLTYIEEYKEGRLADVFLDSFFVELENALKPQRKRRKAKISLDTGITS